MLYALLSIGEEEEDCGNERYSSAGNIFRSRIINEKRRVRSPA